MKSSFRRRLLALFGTVTMGALVGCGAIQLENLGIIQRAYVKQWVWVYETKDGFTQTATAEFEVEFTEFGPDQDGNGIEDSIWSPTGNWRVVNVNDVDMAATMGVSGNTDYADFEMVDVGEWTYPTDPYGGRDYGDVNDRIGDTNWKASSEDAKRSYSIKYHHYVQKDFWVPDPSTNPPETSRPSAEPSVAPSSSASIPDSDAPVISRVDGKDMATHETVNLSDLVADGGFAKAKAAFLAKYQAKDDTDGSVAIAESGFPETQAELEAQSGKTLQVTLTATDKAGNPATETVSLDVVGDAAPVIWLDSFIVGTTPDKPFSDADIKALIVAAHQDDIQPDTVWIDASKYRANWNKPGKSEIPFAYRDSTNDPVRGILTVSVAGK